MDILFYIGILWVAGLVFNTIIGDLLVFTMMDKAPGRMSRKYRHSINVMAIVPFTAPLVFWYLSRTLKKELINETYRTLGGEK
tara:strand:- start:392 stop:640 length:249 start_codon:yes stop_codon:yes gene_type:complete